jgi:starch synthase
MTNPAVLQIAFVSAEVRPLAATGGLGDVASALPKELKKLGHDVRVIMPNYAMIEAQGYKLEEVPGLGDALEVPHVGSIYVKTTNLPDSEVPVYFIEPVDKDYYSRTRDKGTIYGWPDDARRFILLCRGTLEFLNAIAWRPDVIHCNDWHAGLIPAYLDSIYKYDFLSTASLYTTHNIVYSGPGGLRTRTLRQTGLGRELIPTIHPHEFFGKFNFGKGALVLADVANTVSPTYARELELPAQTLDLPPLEILDGSGVMQHRLLIPNGLGFDGVIRHRKEEKPFIGILNGIDYDYWNPETDSRLSLRALLSFIKADAEHLPPRLAEVKPLPFDSLRYAVEDEVATIIERKALHKRRLQQLCGLEENEKALLIGRIGRVSDQKDGLLMVGNAQALREMLALDVQVVVLGRATEGDPVGQYYRRQFTILDEGKPSQFCFLNARYRRWLDRDESWNLPAEVDYDLEHLIYAASDVFLLPSLYEPCGLTQMISFRYGTVPIVHHVGGLADSVIDYDEPPTQGKGRGFVFTEPTPEALVAAVERALGAYQSKTDWSTLIREGMQQDFSWKASAQRYVTAYWQAVNIRRKDLPFQQMEVEEKGD